MAMAAALGLFRQSLLGDRPWSQHVRFLPSLRIGPSAERRYANALEVLATQPDDAIAIDVRLPFCPMLCSYCASDVSVPLDDREIDRYVDTLEREIGLVADRLAGRHDVVQLHFGGGTPNFLSEAQLGRIVNALERRFRLLPETDATIDCDPRRTSAGQLDALRALGFGNVRFGMADLHPDIQRAVGRVQSPALMHDVCDTARSAGFDTVGIDLVYGLPGQTEASLRETLRQVIEMAPDRICCHPYVHRPAERRHQCAVDAAHLPGPGGNVGLLRTAVGTLTDAGYTWLGLDHFVLDTDELAIAHGTGELHCNVMGYTTRPRAHVLGFGAGAIGDVHGTAVRNEASRQCWEDSVSAGTLPVAHAQCRSAGEVGCCEATVRLLCDLELRPSFRGKAADAARARLAPFVAQGLVTVTPDGMQVTEEGHFALDELCAALQHPFGDRRPGVLM